MTPSLHSVRTRGLQLAYEEWGPPDGPPIILLHGFPDDARAWDQVAPVFAAKGYRIVVPYLRGFGPTRFADSSSPRVGQQAALGQDVLDLMEALALSKALIAGYDWGCTAGCAAAILQPERVRALLAIHGYGVSATKTPEPPAPPSEERECWYHWYFHTERGRRGLQTYRREICRLLWKSWSPNWHFGSSTFETTAHSFDNPDFVPVVIHAYRHSHGNAYGDPSLEHQEVQLATLPPIEVPAMVLHGAEDTVHPVHRSLPLMHLFPSGTKRLEVSHAGHFVPRERPDVVMESINELISRT